MNILGGLVERPGEKKRWTVFKRLYSYFCILFFTPNYLRLSVAPPFRLNPFTPRVNYGEMSCSNFRVRGRNPMVWPFKWNLFSSTFVWYHLFVSIVQNKIWNFFGILIFGTLGSYSFPDCIKNHTVRRNPITILPIPQMYKFSSYTFDREAELWLGTTAPSTSTLLCEWIEALSFCRFSFFFLFSSSISVKFSASARLSTAMAKNTLRRMSTVSQGMLYRGKNKRVKSCMFRAVFVIDMWLDKKSRATFSTNQK